MEQAWLAGAIAKSSKTVPLADLMVDVEGAPRVRQTWQEMKAAMMAALPS